MQRKFTDNAGDEWLVFIDTRTVRAARKELGYDLMATFTERKLLELAGDPPLVVDLVYLACREQCDQRGVSDREFGKRLVGDSVEHASDALLRALADFFPTAKRRVLEKILDKADAMARKMTQSLQDATASGEVDRAIDEGLASMATTGPPTAGP